MPSWSAKTKTSQPSASQSAKAKKPNGSGVPCSAKDGKPAGVSKFLSKGTQVYITGRPVLDVYKDKDGNEKIGTDIKVLVNQVELLGGLKTESGGNRLPQVAETEDLPF